jgi:2-polyprenyl-3-methyl-5-hydroxy-6-metoxy-1,4-benzoquinol methylase
MSEGHFKNYTSTSVLAGVDVEKFTLWSHQYFIKNILQHLPTNKDASILEIGCGYGRYTGLLTDILKYEKVIGLDISEEQIQFARNHYNLNNVFCDDAISFLEKDKNKYNTIILMDVLEHLELSYSIKLLQMIKEALLEGGKLIIQVPNGLSPMKPIFYGDVTHVRAFSVSSMSQILRMADFKNFENHAIPPLALNLKSFIHSIIWKTLINPSIKLFMLLTHGSTVGGIYSSNLLTIATKD